MFRFRSEPQISDRIVPLALGATAGLAAGLFLLRRAVRGRTDGELEAGMIDLEERIVDRLAADDVIRDRAVDVAALTDGIVELTGNVRDDEEADRAVRLAQTTPGVRTVLNRLDVEILEEHLSDTRERLQAGDPALTETGWTGVRVGTGLRRQGRETEPDRASDKVGMIERSLGVNRAVEQTSEPLDKIPPAVEGHTSGNAAPTNYGRVDDASHRRFGNVPERPLQDLNPLSRVEENVKPGTELTIEQAEAPTSDEVRRGLNPE